MNLYFSGSSSNIAFILKSSVCISSDELHKSCESLIKDFLCLKAMHNLSLFCGRSIKCNLFIISVNMSYIVIRGKVSRKYFEERIYGMKTIWIKQGFGSLWTVMDESEKADIEVNNLSDILNYL